LEQRLREKEEAVAATTKEELLGEAAREFRGLHEAVRDIMAHIAGWHQEMGPALERLARGERPIREGIHRNTAAADALLELDRTHESFMKVATAVPADRFQPGKTAWKIVDGNSAHHYREHGEQVRAWRMTRGI
jgi:hypothetical protein